MIPENVPFMDVLKEITQKDVDKLEPDEVGFLKARAFYLTPGELKKFASVLEPKKVETKSK